nr:immunoglobulin light chain junction region [Macaca mulatta]MOX73571.1 immunoglobulin light chain junction region [Macaca mulatta]MOX82086.1 immunoglobulin light chain junction region [Macaca mulatta]MOY05315.1 immunoglobulin light chain junction region [Macaca mulatta]MOY07875.1 immunoglobulin light chain junction region [Macaca mulatta]
DYYCMIWHNNVYWVF